MGVYEKLNCTAKVLLYLTHHDPLTKVLNFVQNNFLMRKLQVES